MKEYKFRGKRTDNGEWVYGSFITLKVGKKMASFIIVDNNAVVDHKLPPMAILFTLNKDIFMVKPETVGLFNGLFDVNGNEIYEGDIIKGEYKYEHLIRYNESRAQFTATDLDYLGNKHFESEAGCGINQQWITKFKKEVIGNIHDNPNLLR